MIASVEEYDRAKGLLEMELTHLRRHGHALPERVEVVEEVPKGRRDPVAGPQRDGQQPLVSGQHRRLVERAAVPDPLRRRPGRRR